MSQASPPQMNGIRNGSHCDDADEEKSTNGLDLGVGLLPHHEIDNFTTDQETIHAESKPGSWSNCDATAFNVRRGPDYVSGQKAPSKKALYNVFALDAYSSPQKVNKIFQFVDIEKYVRKYKLPQAYDAEKCPLPPLVIINFMMPNYRPEVYGSTYDGDSFQIVLYAHLTEDALRDVVAQKLSPAIKLFAQFIHSDLVSSDIRNRFKVIARIMNPKHTNFGFVANRLVQRYNGRPFLARTSSTFYHEPGKYFAADIDVHIFGYAARRGLSFIKDTIQTAIYDVGFVIEGQDNDQLPEQILACARVSKIGIDIAVPFPDKHLQRYRALLNHKTKSAPDVLQGGGDDGAHAEDVLPGDADQIHKSKSNELDNDNNKDIKDTEHKPKQLRNGDKTNHKKSPKENDKKWGWGF